MIAILLDHTELYYTGINIIDYNVYVVNALVLFFILSGYLMYKENQTFCLRRKTKSIVSSLLLPYFAFSCLLSIPKALIHTQEINCWNIIREIILGQSSWFVAALCLSELIFAFTLWLTHGKSLAIATISVLGFSVSIYLSTGSQPYIWQLDNSLQALLFLCMGYLYHKHERSFNGNHQAAVMTCLFVTLSVIKIYEQMSGINMMIWYIHINNYPIFLIDITVCSMLMILACKSLPPCEWLEWTGRHSLAYYFLCGGVPLLISKILEKTDFSYNGNYLHVAIAFCLVYVITTFLSWCIYKYLPFMVGEKYKSSNIN